MGIFTFLFFLLLVFLASALLSILYIIFFYLRIWLHKTIDPIPPLDKPPISIIICAQNEYNNLLVLLPILLSQDYPEFEVILVDDGSTDDTTFNLAEMIHQNPNLHIIELTEFVKNKQGKKFALMMGLKGAKYDHVLLSDADCLPASNQWINLMQRNFTGPVEIVLGFAPYRKRPGLLNWLIRYETFITASNYLSFALAKIPYMGVGRNLAYHKHLFFDNKGFSSHIHLMSGDDDLFINQVANSKNTAIEIHPDSFTYSEPKTSFFDYFHQKSRHLSVGKYYKSNHKFLLTLGPVLNLIFYVSFLILCILKYKMTIVLSVFAFRILVSWIVYYGNSRKLKDPGLGILSPILDIFYHIYLCTMTFMGLFYKAKTWK